ncbi:MAG: DUF1116 domain-containing protein [Thermoleophilia bacterium]|nr:DUF1116 domain-containing protein [Thermoleophilia bacterium]
MRLAIATIGAPHVETGLRSQGVEPLVIDWSPPARGDVSDVALLVRSYADDDVEAGNRHALSHLDSARPHLVGAGLAADLVPGMDERIILHVGPPCDWDHLGPALRGQIARAAMLEGWAADSDGAADMIVRGHIAIAPTHSRGVAATMCGVVSPSMAIWAVRDEETGAEAWAPISDGAHNGLGRSPRTRDVLARERLLADRVAPGIARALNATGPLDIGALLDSARTMGGDPSAHPRVALILLQDILLAGLADHALDSLPAITRVTRSSDLLALPLIAAASRAALQATLGVPRSSLVAEITGNGTDVAVMLSGLPDVWFTAPAPMIDADAYNDGYSAADAAPWTGDQAVIACAHLAIDARLCLDAGEAPAIHLGITSRTDGVQIGTGTARVPLVPIRDALNALTP